MWVVTGRHDIPVRQEGRGAAGGAGGCFKSNKRHHAMYPCTEERTRADDYGEIIKVTTLSWCFQPFDYTDRNAEDVYFDVPLQILFRPASLLLPAPTGAGTASTAIRSLAIIKVTP